MTNRKLYRILVINPGSTSTKVAVFCNETPECVQSIRHTPAELDAYPTVKAQMPHRQRLIEEWLRANGIDPHFDAIIGRGGFMKPGPGGVYEVNQLMVDETDHAIHEHACNLGCVMAYAMARKQGNGCRAFIADPVTVDELLPEARMSGSPLMPHVSIWHALNQRAIARRYAAEVGREYADLNLIICHMGGGISIAAHEKGRAVDANNALDGGGPFAPERAGTLPATDLVHLCFSGKYTEKEIKRYIAGEAGLMAHLGTKDIEEIEQRIGQGDEKAHLTLNAMIYHTAKAIAAESAVLCGKVDAILLTGGVAYSQRVVKGIARRVEHLAPVRVFAGEDEMETLALNALDALRGTAEILEYK